MLESKQQLNSLEGRVGGPSLGNEFVKNDKEGRKNTEDVETRQADEKVSIPKLALILLDLVSDLNGGMIRRGSTKRLNETHKKESSSNCRRNKEKKSPSP